MISLHKQSIILYKLNIKPHPITLQHPALPLPVSLSIFTLFLSRSSLFYLPEHIFIQHASMSRPILVTLGRFWPPLVKNMPVLLKAERKKEMKKIQEFTAVGCCGLYKWKSGVAWQHISSRCTANKWYIRVTSKQRLNPCSEPGLSCVNPDESAWRLSQLTAKLFTFS